MQIRLLRGGACVSGAASYCYTVAGHTLVADAPLAYLEPFALPGNPLPRTPVAAQRPEPSSSEMSLLHQDRLWIADAWRTLTCRHHAQGFLLEVEGVGDFAVDAAGQSITCVQQRAEASHTALSETAIGPPLLLALAIRHTWSLHASAVMLDGAGVVFVGDSGAGKSTLAHYLAHAPASSFQRMADDILPIELLDGRLMLLPHYPQLKLARDQQPAGPIPARVPLAALYVLDQTPTDADISTEPLAPQAAMLTFVRHTVATRLFDAGLLAQHLVFCATAGPKVAVRRLRYTRRVESLPRLRALILADVQPLLHL